MKYLLIFIFLLVLVFSGIYFYYVNSPYSTGVKRTIFGRAQSMAITSISFKNNGKIPAKYTCDDASVNPQLSFHAVPTDAKSLVLIVEDQDSLPKGFAHWIVFDIDPISNGIDENTVPDGAQEGTNDFGALGYGGPCPSSGTHRYVFKLFALDTTLGLQRGVKKDEILSKIQGRVLDEAELIGTYEKQ